MEKFQGIVYEKLGNISATPIVKFGPVELEREVFINEMDKQLRENALPNRIKPDFTGEIAYACSGFNDFMNSISHEPITKLDLSITDKGKEIIFAYKSNTDLTFEYLVALE